jgi:hypothetical protein
MQITFLIFLLCMLLPPVALGADIPSTPSPAQPATSKVDPALEAAHAKDDIKRHRTMAAAHEAAAKCQESGRDETACNAELAKACAGIAYGKYCGMKHPD